MIRKLRNWASENLNGIGQIWSFLSFFLIIFTLSSCKEKPASSEKAGIAISFDDHFINDWYALRPLFQKYNARVTFFLTCPDTLTSDEIVKIKQLQKDGHEIGFHGTIHGNATEMLKSQGAQKYIETELKPGLENLAKIGIKPTSYAHPGGNHTDQADSILLVNGFKILRDVAQAERKLFGISIYHFAPRIMNWIYYPFNKGQIVDALMIDEGTNISEKEIKEAIKKGKDTNTAIMLFGHQPLYEKPKNGEYGFSVAFLETILKEAKAQNLRFYTMSELPVSK
ncbi:polysaccharide deacetylase family protein [Dyadobacter sp. CY356]|uniref:polysaccharide deacetylase family protein n=1 Tax=Dyadobacter sp. CY356 TaxID=2906442 RepID=UPI001F22D60C|nr:polysaccharide deacetylase family protein [Dyadobacter sp. CY356]MCF0057751.1 polysaccharide deacetylase family protein [Dyadobacter sp. CY356]